MQEKEYKDNKIAVRPVNLEGYSTTRKSRLLNMPFHILETIMKHCVGVEYLKFRATCKSCRLAGPPTQWSSKTALTRLRMHSVVSPWLVVFDNHRGVMTFTDPVCGDKYYIKPPEELNDRCKIYCSGYGWLLMVQITGLLVVFYNPFTGEIRKLPVLYTGFERLCFSAPPTSPDCMVAAFYKKYVSVLAGSQPSWRRYLLDSNKVSKSSFHFPTFSGPNIYTLRVDKRIEAFRGMGQTLSRKVVVDNDPSSCSKSSREYFMTSCDEHLLLVIMSESGGSVEVFKLNDSTKGWDRLDGLGKHMIFITDASCICLEARLQEMGNKIYFPRVLRDDDTKIVFYSLETCGYHTFDDKSIRESLSGDLLITMKPCFTHAWIEPSWSCENTQDVAA